MTNTELLRDKIKDSGLKISYIAEKLGLSPAHFRRKMNNLFSFDQCEIGVLCDLLHITSLKEKEAIFFAKQVEKNDYKH